MGVVPVSEALRRLSQDPGFWSALLTEDPPTAEDPDAPSELRVPLPVAGGYGLVLDLDLVRREQYLGLREPATSEPVQLGWSAPGRPDPAVLRFAELELCARVIALEDPSLPHPGLVVALLAKFAPVTGDDDAAAAAAVLEAAYRSLRRDVPPVVGAPPSGPEQAPLPLFADDRWWPRPPVESDRVLTEGAIAEFATPVLVAAEPRRGPRFPTAGFAELVRRAGLRLSQLPHEPWYGDARVGRIVRHITGSGDLGPVTDLLGVLTEAGCDHPTVLDALSEPLVPVEACWMVETIAGAEPGSLLRRHLVGHAN
jgi:hypothetical protein